MRLYLKSCLFLFLFLLFLPSLTNSGPFNFKLIPPVSEWFLPQTPTYSTHIIFLKLTHHDLSLLQTLTPFPSHNLYRKRKKGANLSVTIKSFLSTLFPSSFLILSPIIKKIPPSYVYAVLHPTRNIPFMPWYLIFTETLGKRPKQQLHPSFTENRSRTDSAVRTYIWASVLETLVFSVLSDRPL